MEETKQLKLTKEQKMMLQRIRKEDRRKRHKRNRRMLSALLAAGTAIGVYAFYRKGKSEALEAQNDIAKEKYYDAFLQAKKIQLNGENTEKVTIRACFGAVSLELKAEGQKELLVELESIMSAVSIQVPKDVRIRIEEKGKMIKIVNQAEESESEDSPTIYLEIKGVCSGICIRNEAKENEKRGND